MNDQTATRILVSRTDLRQMRAAADPDAPSARPLAPGEARLRIDRFALTSNNITYAAFGDAMKYWQFFPSADTAWAFADDRYLSRSIGRVGCHSGLSPGIRVSAEKCRVACRASLQVDPKIRPWPVLRLTTQR